MKFNIVILVFLSCILIGCMPSIYSLTPGEKQQAEIVLKSGDSLSVLILDADDENLIVREIGKDTKDLGVETKSPELPIAFKSNDAGKSWEKIDNPQEPNMKRALEKKRIKTVTDMDGKDVTARYLAIDPDIVASKSLYRTAEIQTHLYNSYMIGAFINAVILTVLILK